MMKGKLLYKRAADALQILVRLAGKDAQRSFLHAVVDKGLPAWNGSFLDRADRVAENTWRCDTARLKAEGLRAAAYSHRMEKLLWYWL